MKRKQQFLQGTIAATGFLVLIFDSSLALEGAGSGITLCIQTVIPSLFPFFVLSMILTNALADCRAYPLQKIAAILGIPQRAAAVLIPSVLGGYPVGAKSVADLYQRKQIGRKEAERMLAFCNNAGPAFLFGMVSGFFPDKLMIWQLWFIHLLSAALTALSIPAMKTSAAMHPAETKSVAVPIIQSSAKAMGLVCSWVILFRIILAFLESWFLWILPGWLQVFLVGALELTNGCCELLIIPDVKLRFVLCACMLGFGGICVFLQTVSVAEGLSLRYYIKGKLLQTGFSFLLGCMIVTDHGIVIAAAIPIFVLILRKIQNRYGNPGILPV